MPFNHMKCMNTLLYLILQNPMICFRYVLANQMKKGANNCLNVEYAFLSVGCTGIEPVTSCLSSKRSEPTELTPRMTTKLEIF